MATPRWKSEKESKDSKTNTRRASLPDDGYMRDILREVQKISEKQDLLQKEVQSMARKQDLQQKTFQDEMSELRRELREEIGSMKKEIVKNSSDINDLRLENRKMEKVQSKVQNKIENLEEKNKKLEKIQEKMESQALEFQLRYRNVQEEVEENIGWVITQLTAKLLNCTDQEACGQINRVYRINTNYTRKNKAIKDVVVNFLKRSTRDEVLRQGEVPQIIQEKEIFLAKG
nr:PREDICTED: myosin-6-like [Anolis carolinensis]|eukprot:XP_016847150.1 PREDICTED: myosin-6-like [Anolis carolinensis]